MSSIRVFKSYNFDFIINQQTKNMNDAHLHLLVNHFPIIGTIFGLGILIAGIIFKNNAVKNVSYVIFIVTAIFALIAMSTGEGAEEIVETKKLLGLNPDEHFAMPAEVLEHVRQVKARGAATRKSWNEKFAIWQSANPERAKLLQRLISGELPKGWDTDLPQYPAGFRLLRRFARHRRISKRQSAPGALSSRHSGELVR